MNERLQIIHVHSDIHERGGEGAFSARRALAAGIRRGTCSAAEATYVQCCDDQPAADPACCFDCPVDPAPAEQ